MNILQRAALKWKQRNTINPFNKTEHIIVPAFEVGGVNYYEFETLANLPFKRGAKFLSVYNEIDMRVDRGYLKAHTEAIKKLKGGKLDLDTWHKIFQLNAQLEERTKIIFDEDLVYKLASVVFFDANENPDNWEWGYALKKIEFWKKHEGVHDFFLHEPIRRLIPFLNNANINLATSFHVSKEVDKLHLENLWPHLSEATKKVLSNSTSRYYWEATGQK